jgi:hypothetical protein
LKKGKERNECQKFIQFYTGDAMTPEKICHTLELCQDGPNGENKVSLRVDSDTGKNFQIT